MKGLAFQEKATANIAKRSLVLLAVWMKTCTLHSFFVYILCEEATDKTKRLHLYKVLSPQVYQGSSGKTASLPNLFSQTHLVTPIQTLKVVLCGPHYSITTPLLLSVALY